MVLKMKLRGIVEQGYIMLYGKSQVSEDLAGLIAVAILFRI